MKMIPAWYKPFARSWLLADICSGGERNLSQIISPLMRVEAGAIGRWFAGFFLG